MFYSFHFLFFITLEIPHKTQYHHKVLIDSGVVSKDLVMKSKVSCEVMMELGAQTIKYDASSIHLELISEAVVCITGTVVHIVFVKVMAPS